MKKSNYLNYIFLIIISLIILGIILNIFTLIIPEIVTKIEKDPKKDSYYILLINNGDIEENVIFTITSPETQGLGCKTYGDYTYSPCKVLHNSDIQIAIGCDKLPTKLMVLLECKTSVLDINFILTYNSDLLLIQRNYNCADKDCNLTIEQNVIRWGRMVGNVIIPFHYILK